jgi:ribosomal protein L11 methyltransferase
VIRLGVRAPAGNSEPVLAALLELAPAGLEQVDGAGWVEFALYGEHGDLPPIGPGPVRLGGVEVEVRTQEVAGDWIERWRAFHRPALVAGRLYVRPPWEPRLDRAGVVDVPIDPGRAFGTGAHPTTRLCLELMLDLEPSGSFDDVGCGSGVLAIAAAKLGWAPVCAWDHDPAALEATRANARLGGVELDSVGFLDLETRAPPAAEVLAANLVRPLLLRMAAGRGWRPPPVLLLSGLLESEADEVAAAFEPLHERRRLVREGWSALLLERRAPRLGP